MSEKRDWVRMRIECAARRARQESADAGPPPFAGGIEWPVTCTVGPGLEGAIACESKIGYVNGLQGQLIYRGYDVFDLCAQCTFEEVGYLLLSGDLPSARQLERFKKRLVGYRHLPGTLRMMMGFPVERMHAMAALRLGTNLMRQEFTNQDLEAFDELADEPIGADEDSMAMETRPVGHAKAVYEFETLDPSEPKPRSSDELGPAASRESCCRLIAGMPTLAAAVHRLTHNQLPIEPDPELGHAANLLYMIHGRRPTSEEEHVLDVALILHADHGMNASTFASLVVASTLADPYFAVGAGIGALSGPLHGGANEQVVNLLAEIGSPRRVRAWTRKAIKRKQKIAGFGHRVYKTYDPRARILKPLAEKLAQRDPESRTLFRVAASLEREVVATLGKEKRVFPNVDFYSGIVYQAMGLPPAMFTPLFAVSRVAGWAARILEYLEHNRIFRPRAVYTGPFGKRVVPLAKR